MYHDTVPFLLPATITCAALIEVMKCTRDVTGGDDCGRRERGGGRREEGGGRERREGRRGEGEGKEGEREREGREGERRERERE